jgi:hypothetical protein
MTFQWSLSQIDSYIRTWSAYKNYCATEKQADILKELIDFIRIETKVTSDDQVLDVAFQMVMILCKK